MTLALAGILGFLFLQDAASLLDQGRRFLDAQNPKAAERVFRDLVARYPEDSRASYYLGIALARQERTEEAVGAFEAARRGGSKRPNPSVLFELGRALSKLGRFPEAERALREATELAPEEPAFRLQLGWVYYSSLEGEKARTEFERVIAASPSPTAFLYLGLTEVGLGRTEPAVDAFREAIRRDPGLLDAHVALGKVLARAGRDEEAKPVLVRAIEIDPASAESRFQLGLIALRHDDLDDALRSFEEAIAADPAHLQAWYNRALVAERLGEAETARVSWARVAELRASGAEDADTKRRTRARYP
jgi:tetratricopeptide (TPR) repeat protein